MVLYHSRDLRKGRFSKPGHYYLITTVTYRREKLFRDWQAGRIMPREFARVQRHVNTFAWVVMPDHFHWLVQLVDGDLSLAVQQVKSRSAISINAFWKREGPVWQKGFHDHALRHDEDIQHVARYIIANPLRAGLVKDIGQYPLWDAVWV